jgi:hypothetical protein
MILDDAIFCARGGARACAELRRCQRRLALIVETKPAGGRATRRHKALKDSLAIRHAPPAG